MWIERIISAELRRCLAEYPAVILTGARQTGKTSLAEHLLPDHRYVSLDVPENAALAEQSPRTFLEHNPAPIVLDEVQYAPGVMRHLKVLIDADRHAMGRFVLTGSQKFPLMKEAAESLAGRVAVFELEGLTAAELVLATAAARTPGALGALTVRGTFPELWRQPGLGRDRFYQSYLATYLERDLRALINIGKLRDFERFMRLTATRTGQLLNKSDLARDVGVSVPTIGEWLSALEASGQIVFLAPYFENVGKRLVKTPKLYFADPGFAAFLLGLGEGAFESSALAGPLWETLVFAELRRLAAASGTSHAIWYYRDQHAREVDFIVQTARGLVVADAKLKELPDLRDLATVEFVASLLAAGALPVVARAVACRALTTYPLGPGRYAVSGFELDRLLRPEQLPG